VLKWRKEMKANATLVEVHPTLRVMLSILSIVIALSSCVNLERNYKPAGFNSGAEVTSYLPYNFYFAKKLTPDEWAAFYNRFPEYWKDLQVAKHHLGGTTEYHPWYTAYAFRWTTLNKKLPNWDQIIRERLSHNKIEIGDDVFKIVYALAPPVHLIWDNDFEILLYQDPPIAVIMNDGLAKEIKPCEHCWQQVNTYEATNEGSGTSFSDDELISTLGLTRPKY
jgi:hypothetical protein